ncbi:LysE family transporter [Pseudomonas sp. NPDC007930]|uniref:LysE family translocator n=1 Tax=Pseudomonas sp. NPDC007930 TaxID=3364417 RepID=UPI0036EEDCC4
MPNLLPLLLFVAAATFSPGGATALATASGARFGLARSLPLILGIAAALWLLAALAGLGLGELVGQRPALQWALKLVGSLYLLWLAWLIARSGAPASGAAVARPLGLGKAMLLLLANPKSWAMTVSAAAAFSPLASSPYHLALLLGAAFALAACVSLGLWCALGVLLARRLRSAWQWRLFNGLMAALLVVSIIPMWR